MVKVRGHYIKRKIPVVAFQKIRIAEYMVRKTSKKKKT